VASLFFVRVTGPAKEDGFLREFNVDKKFYIEPKLNFHTVFENNGSVSLNPHGKIEIKNIIGSAVGEVTIEPYFVLPAAARAMDIAFDRGFMFGRYTATISLSRGYGDQIDSKTLAIWVLPYKAVGLTLLIILIIVLLIQGFRKWFKANFQRKTPEKIPEPSKDRPEKK
jgi:hypothetical protein